MPAGSLAIAAYVLEILHQHLVPLPGGIRWDGGEVSYLDVAYYDRARSLAGAFTLKGRSKPYNIHQKRRLLYSPTHQ